jgi:putative sensor protein
MFETASTAPARNPVLGFLASFFGVLVSGRAYLNVLYLWLAFPLGLTYFVLLVTGFSVGIGLMIVWIGLGILFVLMLAIWALEGLERVLAIGLLGAELPLRLPASDAVGVKNWLKAVFKSSALWKGTAFLFIKFPLGMVCWIVSVVTLSVSIALTLSPFAHWFGSEIVIEDWIFDPAASWPVLAIVGFFMLLVTLHLHNAMAWVWKKLAEVMLGEGTVRRPDEATPVFPSGETAGTSMALA